MDKNPKDRVKFRLADKDFKSVRDRSSKKGSRQGIDDEPLIYQDYHIDKLKLENRAKKTFRVDKMVNFDYHESQNVILHMIQIEAINGDGENSPDEMLRIAEMDNLTSDLNSRGMSVANKSGP